MSVIQSSFQEILHNLMQHTTNLPPSILVSATYDGNAKAAVLKFYNPETERIHLWIDNTGHKPYAFSKLSKIEVENVLKDRPDILGFEEVEKRDLTNDTNLKVTKIIVSDPLAIGGSQGDRSIRNIIDAWEADIKYYENYLYDAGLITGSYYGIENSKILPVESPVPDTVKEKLRKTLDQAESDFKQHLLDWAQLLNQPLPHLKRAAIDIEVFSAENRIPDAVEAQNRVLAISLVGSDLVREVYILKRREIDEGEKNLDSKVMLHFFEEERELLRKFFDRLLSYPFIITFNGDDFDMKYLYYRAQKLGFDKEQIPISLGSNVANLKHGVHIDLYRTFINRSIQIYAFSNKYVDHTLGGIAEGLLGQSKIEFEGSLAELPLFDLARYNYNDALITFNLTSFNEDLLMKLLLVISRVAKMPIDDVSRLSVSNWIRSLLYYEHRRIGALIPKKEELELKGGAVSTAITKGKKYKGGLVVEPRAGVHFNVAVLDFASLYPSIIKVQNLSYETVRCGHEECKTNLAPETDHWICTKRRGLTSLVIGSLRDLRVNYYKPLTKDNALTSEERSLYGVVSQALKVILNAAYGVMGAEIFPLYCLPVAEATASIGRSAITRTIEKCKEIGIEVIYGDTDSLFLKSPSEKQIHEISSWTSNELGIELDLEKLYRYVAFSERKKNYLGVLEDGSVDIKGLTGKKSHTPEFIKQAFYRTVEILSNVRSTSEFESARDEIKKDLRSKYIALKERKIPLVDLTFNVMISKTPDKYQKTTPQHVKAAQQLKREVKAGEIISYVKTTTPPGVKPVEKASINEIDNEKYLEYLRGTFDQLLDALGYEFDQIMGSTKLEEFFYS